MRSLLIVLFSFWIYILPCEALERIIVNGKPSQLELEIKSIPNFPKKGIQTYYKEKNVLLYIDETLSPLTVSQISQVDAIIAAHVPDWTTEQKEQEYIIEIETNDFCSAELSALNDRINIMRDSINTDINNATNFSQIKTVLINMNAVYSTAFKKVTKCVRARAK